MRTMGSAIGVILLGLGGCADPAPLSKDDARERGGKSDDGVDYCELFDWYGDYVCDDFCPQPDPDCPPAGFELVRIGTGGFCPPAVDCTGFIEVSAAGALRLDLSGEPGGALHEASLTQAEVAALVPLVTDPALLALLDGAEPPCPVPTDFFERLSVRIAGVEHASEVTGCDLPAISAVRDRLEELADRARPRPDFARFVLSTGGFCPPSIDCSSFIELAADGTLRVDRSGELPVVVHEAKLPAGELAAAIAVLTDPALIGLLDLGETPCLQPTDFTETMRLEDAGGEHVNQTTSCDEAPIAAARELMRSLAERAAP